MFSVRLSWCPHLSTLIPKNSDKSFHVKKQEKKPAVEETATREAVQPPVCILSQDQRVAILPSAAGFEAIPCASSLLALSEKRIWISHTSTTASSDMSLTNSPFPVAFSIFLSIPIGQAVFRSGDRLPWLRGGE